MGQIERVAAFTRSNAEKSSPNLVKSKGRTMGINSAVQICLVGAALALGVSQFADAQSAKCQVRDKDISAVYKGGCKDGLAHGKGLAKGRDVFEGEFFEGDKVKGKYTWNSGTTYEGEFKNDALEGQGTMRNAKGELVFAGNWIKGKPQGKTEQQKQEAAKACGQPLGAYQKATCGAMTTDNYQCILGAADRYKQLCGK